MPKQYRVLVMEQTAWKRLQQHKDANKSPNSQNKASERAFKTWHRLFGIMRKYWDIHNAKERFLP